MEKQYIEDGTKCWIGGIYLIRDKASKGGFIYDGSQDEDMYYDGKIVNYDTEKEEFYIDVNTDEDGEDNDK